MDGEVEIDETYFGPQFKNRCRANRRKLHPAGQVFAGRGVGQLKQAVFGIYEQETEYRFNHRALDPTEFTNHLVQV